MCRLEEQGCAEVAEAGGGGCCAAASKRTCIMEALTETPVFKDPDIASPLSAGLCVQQYVRKERKKEVP